MGPFIWQYAFATIVATIVCLCMIPASKNKVKKMEEELEYLKTNCFN